MNLKKCLKGPHDVILNVCKLLKVFDPNVDFCKFQIAENIDDWYFIVFYDDKDIPCFFWDAMLKVYGHLELEIL